jgi:hypothetical protein
MTTSPAVVPKSMKAVVVDKTGPPNTLHIKEVPVPTVARNHVLIALESPEWACGTPISAQARGER